LSWDDIIIEGNPLEYKFAAYYVKEADEIRSNPGALVDM
jgi:hypothetical protein